MDNPSSNRNADNHAVGVTPLPRPAASSDPNSLAKAEAWCRRLARSHYENFLVATAFLPRQLRQPFYNIYAFCRSADDLADESGSPEAALAGLADFQNRLDATYLGRPEGEVFIALHHTASEFQLPKSLFDRLLAAFRQDQTVSRYGTRHDLLAYCQGSANPVGETLLYLCQCHTEENVSLSDEICTGLQLANFWQDVKRDFAMGRIYLPQETWLRFGVTEAMFSEPVTPVPLREAIRWECDLARSQFRAGLALADRVPAWFARDVRLFAHGGLAVIDAIKRIDADVLGQRVVVTKWTQLRLLVLAWLGRL